VDKISNSTKIKVKQNDGEKDPQRQTTQTYTKTQKVNQISTKTKNVNQIQTSTKTKNVNQTSTSILTWPIRPKNNKHVVPLIQPTLLFSVYSKVYIVIFWTSTVKVNKILVYFVQ
jgi:hypothetical protein